MAELKYSPEPVDVPMEVYTFTNTFSPTGSAATSAAKKQFAAEHDVDYHDTKARIIDYNANDAIVMVAAHPLEVEAIENKWFPDQ